VGSGAPCPTAPTSSTARRSRRSGRAWSTCWRV
jgi:hypothetical protein